MRKDYCCRLPALKTGIQQHSAAHFAPLFGLKITQFIREISRISKNRRLRRPLATMVGDAVGLASLALRQASANLRQAEKLAETLR